MKTLRLFADPSRIESSATRAAMEQAAEILHSGGLVAFPTETVYGLGANALDPGAVSRIFAAKERPSWDPVIVHIAGPVDENPMLDHLVNEVPESARKLMAAFWPGPLTLLLPRSAAVPDAVTAGRPLVGLRMPSHPVAFELIRLAGVPLAAPSANTFSRISPTTPAHVLEDLDGRIDAILDAGPTEHGIESTVLDPCQSPMVIYRPGAISPEQITSAAGPVKLFQPDLQPSAAPRESLPSPGVGIRHYAPRARLILVEAPFELLRETLTETTNRLVHEDIGVMLPTDVLWDGPGGEHTFSWGRWSAPEEMAHLLYAGLRELDAHGCTTILCPLPPGEGISEAIRDRLRKAAREK